MKGASLVLFSLLAILIVSGCTGTGPTNGKPYGDLNLSNLDKNCSVDSNCKRICALDDCYNNESFLVNDCGHITNVDCSCVNNICEKVE
jgi:hypothetical protein